MTKNKTILSQNWSFRAKLVTALFSQNWGKEKRFLKKRNSQHWGKKGKKIGKKLKKSIYKWSF